MKRMKSMVPIHMLPLILMFTVPAKGCGPSEFPLLLDNPTACTATTCPGHCVDKVCCVEQCFDMEHDPPRISTECVQGGDTTCSGFEAEIQCVADLFNSSAEICKEQVLLLFTGRTISGDFQPRHCPCENGYVKANVNLSVIPDLCKLDGACYDVTSNVTNVTIHCVGPALIPDGRACEAGERLDSTIICVAKDECDINCGGICRDAGSACEPRERIDKAVIYVAKDECDINCGGTCRDAGTGKLPACCTPVNAHAQPPPEEDGGGDELHAGFIVLIVGVVVILLVTALFGWLYISRYRHMRQQQKVQEEFTDINADDSDEVNASSL